MMVTIGTASAWGPLSKSAASTRIAVPLAILLACLGTAAPVASAYARPGAGPACLSDAMVDQAFGDQVRSGALFIDTTTLPDRPLCSGITVAQEIQHLRNAAFPEEQREIAARHAEMARREEQRAMDDELNRTMDEPAVDVVAQEPDAMADALAENANAVDCDCDK